MRCLCIAGHRFLAASLTSDALKPVNAMPGREGLTVGAKGRLLAWQGGV